jgi:hypothetical protein
VSNAWARQYAVTDNEITSIPRGIPAKRVAEFLGVTVERVEAARGPKRKVGRPPLHMRLPPVGGESEALNKVACEDGSWRLLRRQLETGQHGLHAYPELLAQRRKECGL